MAFCPIRLKRMPPRPADATCTPVFTLGTTKAHIRAIFAI